MEFGIRKSLQGRLIFGATASWLGEALLLLYKQAVSTPSVLQLGQTGSAVCTLLCTFMLEMPVWRRSHRWRLS